MLNMTLIRGNNQYAAAHYFSAADDYYAKENPGEWQGKGTAALALSGPIEPGQLSRLLNGDLPKDSSSSRNSQRRVSTAAEVGL